MENMSSAEIPVLVNLLAIYLSNGRSNDELTYLAVVFNQLGDTLATIAFLNSFKDKNKEKE